MRSGTFVFAAAVLFAAAPVASQGTGGEPRPMNVRLAFQIIGTDGPARDEPEIRAVVTELRKLFRFEGYHLLASSILNATAWPPSSVEQHVADQQGRRFAIEAQVQSNGPGIRLEVRLHDGGMALINAAVNLENGKTVVLGTADVRSPSRTGRDDPFDRVDRAYADLVRRLVRTADYSSAEYGRLATRIRGQTSLLRGGEARRFMLMQGELQLAGENTAIILVVTPTINP